MISTVVSVVVLAGAAVSACHAQTVSLTSRHSEARERSYTSQDGVVTEHYNNQLSFDGPGDWSGSLPDGLVYSSFADSMRIGGAFESRGGRQDFSLGLGLYEESTESSWMTARIDVSDRALVNLTFEARGQGSGGEPGINAELRITSVQTGEIVYSMTRDGMRRQAELGYAYWDLQTTLFELGSGVYEIEMYADLTHWYDVGGGSRRSYAYGFLEADMRVTPVPSPATCVLLGLSMYAASRCSASRRRRGSVS